MDINWRVKSSNAPKRGGGGKPLICNCQCVRRTYRIRSKTSADQIEKRECDDRRKKTLHRIYPKYTWDMFAACPSPVIPRWLLEHTNKKGERKPK
jgi:hypothetical protein